MKKREFYFIVMGIGIGTIVSGIVFKMSPPPAVEYSDEKVIERAEELGMVGLKERIESNEAEENEVSEEVEGKSDEKETASESSGDSVAAETVEIEILSGEGTGTIARKLLDKRVIDNEAEFKQFVEDLGASKKFRQGTYTIEADSDYETTLSILTKGAY